MKKFLFIVLSMYACQVMAQMTPNKRYAPAYEQDCYKGDEMVEAGRSWASRPIKVKGGGKAPGTRRGASLMQDEKRSTDGWCDSCLTMKALKAIDLHF